MKSMFDIKNPLPFDEKLFNKMSAIAKESLEEAKKQQYTQSIVLLTSCGGEYCSVITNALSAEKTDEADLIERLIAANDTCVSSILCMWGDGNIDIPSFAFRKILCELNPDNLNAGILVNTFNGYSAIKLGNTMK